MGWKYGEILQKHAKYCKSYLVYRNLTYHTLALAILNMTIGSDTCRVYNKFTAWLEIQNDADSNQNHFLNHPAGLLAILPLVEPSHEKNCFCCMQTLKTQISLFIYIHLSANLQFPASLLRDSKFSRM